MQKRYIYLVKFYLFFFYLLLSHTISSQTKLKFENFNLDNGLASNYIDVVYNDSYNYLWVGTYNGLNRFDGYSFKLYKKESDSTGLSSNTVIGITEDSNKDLWIGTINGLSFYNREKDIITPVKLLPKKEVFETATIIEENNNVFWIGTYSGICKYNKRTKETKWFDMNTQKGILTDTMIKDMFFEKSKDLIWFSTNNGGLYTINTKTDKILPFSAYNKNDLHTKKVRNISIDQNNQIWVSSYDAGIAVINPVDYSYKVYNIQNSNLGSNHTIVNCTKDNSIWACCVNGYLNKFNRETEQFIQFKPDFDDPYSIQAVSPSCIFEDDDNNLWIGTHANGLYKVVKQKQFFDYYIPGQNSDNKLNSGKVASFLEYKNELWIATDGGGINILNRKTGAIDKITLKNGLSSDWVLDLVYGADSNIYAATWQGGIIKINPETRSLLTIKKNANSKTGLSFNNVKALAAFEHFIIVGTHGDGINIYNTLDNTVETKFWKFELNKTRWINALFVDSQKRIWIGTQQGLYMFDGKILQDFTNGTNPRAVLADRTYQIQEDKKGIIWIASELGLCSFNQSSKSFDFINKELNIPNSVKSVLTDGNGNLWIGTNSGIYRIDSTRKKTISIAKEDGLLSNYFIQKSAKNLADGSLVFGAIEGFNIFNPDSVLKSSSAKKVVLSSLYIGNKEILCSESNSNLNRILAFTDTLIIRPNQSEFSLYFNVVSPSGINKIQYAYRLKGFNNDWAFVEKEHKATYTNLNPGEYIFEVSTYNTFFEIDKNSTTLHIIVLPPWWKTMWFRVALSFAIILIIILSFYIRTRSIKQRNKLLEKEVRKRTQELFEINALLLDSSEEVKQQNEKLEISNYEITKKTEKIIKQQEEIIKQKDILTQNYAELKDLNSTKDKFFSIIAHDLKNPVNALTGFSELLMNQFDNYDKEKIRKFVFHIHSSSNSIQNLLLNLLDWARTQSKQHKVYLEMISLTDIFNEIARLFERQLEDKKISLIINIEDNTKVYADYNMINVVFRNIVSNAIKFTPEKGSITVDSIKGKTKISDSGIGMTKEQMNALFKLDHAQSTNGTNNETGTGLGLLICKEFVEINNGTISIESEQNIGTSFTIALPLNENEKPLNNIISQGNFVKSFDRNYTFTEEDVKMLEGKTLLIVDDDTAIRSALHHTFSDKCELMEASNGEEAINLCKEYLPDIIISDISMPGMNGFQLCKNLKSDTDTCHIPIILLADSPADELKAKEQEVIVDAFIYKPINQQMIIIVINNILSDRYLYRNIFIHNFETDQLSLLQTDKQLISTLSRIIENNLNEPSLSADYLSETASIRKNLLHKKIKTLTGLTINEFIMVIKLKRSIMYLSDKKYTIPEVALKSGFNNYHYFEKAFIKVYKIHPSEYLGSDRFGI
ncbi:MAG: response regulator [Bacteroidales bacterium]|nr:response regulator [Bacteroidales bacterium]